MARKRELSDDPQEQWHHLVRVTFRCTIPVSDEHAWTAIARVPLAADWEGPALPKHFPTNVDFARAVLVTVVDRGPETISQWRSAQDQEREQLAEALAVASEVENLLAQGQRPATDEERNHTLRAAQALAWSVLDRLAEEEAG